MIFLLSLLLACGPSTDRDTDTYTDTECLLDLAACDGECVDLFQDPSNCGACGEVCSTEQECIQAACEAVCLETEERCDGSCVDVRTNPDRCGGCDTTCGGNEECLEGGCVPQCEVGETLIEGNCYDLRNDRMNCGTVGDECAADEECVTGTCARPCTQPSDCTDPLHVCTQAEYFDPLLMAGGQIETPDACDVEPARYCGNPFQCQAYGEFSAGNPDGWVAGWGSYCNSELIGNEVSVCWILDPNALITFPFVRR